MQQQLQEKPFYVVSLGKLTLMYFCTLGLYRFYWFFRGFSTMQAITGRSLFPVGRTLFYVLFSHELFNFVRGCQKAAKDDYFWQPNKLAWLVIGINVLQVVAMFTIANHQASWFWHFLLLLTVHFVQFAVLYKVQLIINRIAQDPFGDANSQITTQNRLWIILGAMLWAQTFYGYYLQATGQWPPPQTSPLPETQAPASFGPAA